jgi:hypothetical protein
VHPLLLLLPPPAEAKVDAGLAARATGGAVQGFSKAMTLRRLHWRNSLLGELLYTINVAKVGVWACGGCSAICGKLQHAGSQVDWSKWWGSAHVEHQQVWAGPSWSSYALQVRSLLYMGSV